MGWRRARRATGIGCIGHEELFAFVKCRGSALELLDEAEWIIARLDEAPDLRPVDVQHGIAARDAEVSYASVQRTVKRLGLRLKNAIRDRTGPA
ncbi:hypothetical protein BH10PSE12_BH10PSE12_07490 [soil metagenome]